MPASARSRRKADGVFLNCPFDESYRQIFNAIIFTIYDCGFLPRCALEVDDGTETRISKILSLIRHCRFGIHDISYTRLDPLTGLPRFNMPFELGVFFGCKSFGAGRLHGTKYGLILDEVPFRYQRFISDLAGLDIRYHHGDPGLAVKAVREWLRTISRSPIPGAETIWKRYARFQRALPRICRQNKIRLEDIGSRRRGWRKPNNW